MDKATYTCEIRNEIEARINGFLVDHSRIRQDINDSESVIDEYNRRQIFEMLQNIDDQLDGASDSSDVRSCLIQFDEPERKLVFKNLGEPFSAKGVHSIMLPHISPKKSLGKTTIGNKGLGFRSLLNWAPETIIIRSNGVELAFSEEIVADIIKGNGKLQEVLQNEIGRARLPFLTFPEIRERQVTSKWSTEIELSWNAEKSKGIPESVAKDIEGELRGFKAELMLFLPNLRRVNIEIKAADGSLEKFGYGATPWEALAEGDGKVFRRRISRFNEEDEISYVEWVAYQETHRPEWETCGHSAFLSIGFSGRAEH